MNQTFAIGQRYVSDKEPELGLGVVVDTCSRTVSVLFVQAQEKRIYASASAALTRVVFEAGDVILDLEGNQKTVAKVEDIQGVKRYHLTDQSTLMEGRLSANMTLNQPLKRLLGVQIDNKDAFEVRYLTQEMRAHYHAHPLHGFLGAKVLPLAHQLYIADDVASRLAPRVLLSDEVGLGKTIEAGLIIHKKLITGEMSRILVLVPDSLQYQWLFELKDKFNLEFANMDLVRAAAIKEHDAAQNVFLTDQLFVTSIELLLDHPDLYTQAFEAGFDLLVVDEAHHLQADATGESTNAHYDLVCQLAHQTPGLILLSATPEQLGLESHFERLRLLDPVRYDTFDAFMRAQEAFMPIAELAKALIEGQHIPKTGHDILRTLPAYPSEENALNCPKIKDALLDELLEHYGTGRAVFRNTRKSLNAKTTRRVQGYALDIPKAWIGSRYHKGTLRDQLWGHEGDESGEWLTQDPRVDFIASLLKGQLRGQKALLITRSGLVASFLEGALRHHFDIKTALFTEEMSLLERDKAASAFAKTQGAQLLLASEVGSEGRNFQFAKHLILFDLPANADTLEQRIGRLDRIGQDKEMVIHIPYLKDTAMHRLFDWYDKGLNVFEQVCVLNQSIQEAHIVRLKDALLGQGDLETLIYTARAHRDDQIKTLGTGKDQLLEYQSCRPHGTKLVQCAQDAAHTRPLNLYLQRVFDVLGVDYLIQSDCSYIVRESMEGITTPINHLVEGGRHFTLDLTQAIDQGIEYMSLEHPLMRALFEWVDTHPYGNATVAALHTNALPAGMIALETVFRVHLVGDKALNLWRFLPKDATLKRIFLLQGDKDLSEIVGFDAICNTSTRVNSTQAAGVIQARSSLISSLYKSAKNKAAIDNKALIDTSCVQFLEAIDSEIARLDVLIKRRGDSLALQNEKRALEDKRAQGLYCLKQLALVPDMIRVLVTAPA